MGDTLAGEGVKMIRYADDFILMSRHIKQELISKLHTYIQRMELTINTEKSKKVNVKQESFDFWDLLSGTI